MRKSKVMFISLLAVFAVGAVASSSASAFLWEVSGKKNFGSEQISTASITIVGGKLTGDGISITCGTLRILGGLINEGNPGTGKASTAKFESCEELNEPTKCQLPSATIETKSGTVEIVSANEIEIKPTGTEFVTIEVTKKGAKTCLLEGSYTVTGSARLTVGNASTNEVEHLLTFNTNSKLAINSNTATIEGSGKGMLVLLLPWSIQS